MSWQCYRTSAAANAVEGISNAYREMMFKEIHPSGQQEVRIGRRTDLSPIHITCQAIQYLGTFFHDGKVSGKVCIKYIIKTQFTKGVHHLSVTNVPAGSPNSSPRAARTAELSVQ